MHDRCANIQPTKNKLIQTNSVLEQKSQLLGLKISVSIYRYLLLFKVFKKQDILGCFDFKQIIFLGYVWLYMHKIILVN